MKMNSYINFKTLDDQTKFRNSIGEGSDNLSTVEKQIKDKMGSMEPEYRLNEDSEGDGEEHIIKIDS